MNELDELFGGEAFGGLSEEQSANIRTSFEGHINGLVNNRNSVLEEKRLLDEEVTGLRAIKEKVGDFDLSKLGELQAFYDQHGQSEEERVKAEEEKFNSLKSQIDKLNISNAEQAKLYEEKINALNSIIFDNDLEKQINEVALADENFVKTPGALKMLKMATKEKFKMGEDGKMKYHKEKYNTKGDAYSFNDFFNEKVKAEYKELFTSPGGTVDTDQGGRTTDAGHLGSLNSLEQVKKALGRK